MGVKGCMDENRGIFRVGKVKFWFSPNNCSPEGLKVPLPRSSDDLFYDVLAKSAVMKPLRYMDFRHLAQS